MSAFEDRSQTCHFLDELGHRSKNAFLLIYNITSTLQILVKREQDDTVYNFCNVALDALHRRILYTSILCVDIDDVVSISFHHRKTPSSSCINVLFGAFHYLAVNIDDIDIAILLAISTT